MKQKNTNKTEVAIKKLSLENVEYSISLGALRVSFPVRPIPILTFGDSVPPGSLLEVDADGWRNQRCFADFDGDCTIEKVTQFGEGTRLDCREAFLHCFKIIVFGFRIWCWVGYILRAAE